MPISIKAFQATPEANRIDSLDIIRGVAVLGILLMNIVGMGLPMGAYSDPTVIGGDTGLNLWAWGINEMLFEGTMRGLFSMLFGAGAILFTSRKEAQGIGLALADSWYRRTIWLFIFGMIHAYILLWPWDILYSYGLLGMFLFPVRNISPKYLLSLGLFLILAGTVLQFFDLKDTKDRHAKSKAVEAMIARGETPSKDQQASLDGWNKKIKNWTKTSSKEMEEESDKIRAGYFSAMKARAEETYFAESMWHYSTNYFDVLSMMLIGMAFFGWRIFQAERSFLFYGVLLLVGYGVGLPVNWWETSLLLNANFDLIATGRVHLTHELGRVFTMVGHVGLIMLFCKSGALPLLQHAMAAVGRMALTNYIMHTVITTTVFVSFAQFGLWQRHQLYYLVIGIWALQIVLSPIWLKYFYFGPLEWVWRALTYLKRPAFRRYQSVTV